jgi:hypothetical protein
MEDDDGGPPVSAFLIFGKKQVGANAVAVFAGETDQLRCQSFLP